MFRDLASATRLVRKIFVQSILLFLTTKQRMQRILANTLLILVAVQTDAFVAVGSRRIRRMDGRASSFLNAEISDDRKQADVGTFDPFSFEDGFDELGGLIHRDETNLKGNKMMLPMAVLASGSICGMPSMANALDKIATSTGDFDPESFRPVCSYSDSLYRVLQGLTRGVVGDENFVEYGPLIAGGLLRIRLELCVVESFFNEAVGPFIQKNGLNWVLPLHETVETFLAGTVFAAASTFILVGSTKIVSVLFTYTDVFLGAPSRWIGGFFFDRAQGRPVTLEIGIGPFKTQILGPKIDKEAEAERNLVDFENVTPSGIPVLIVSGALKAFGETSKITKDTLEGLDLFVGRYLTLLATGYIGLKFIHFKVFPDFPNDVFGM